MFRSASYAIKQAFRQVFRNRAMSVASLFSITAMLLILGLLFILIVNVGMITEQSKTQFDTIQIYMLETPDESLTAEEGAAAMEELTETLMNALAAMPQVSDVEYVSKVQAMEEYRVKWGDKAYLLDSLSHNPLPNSVRVTVGQLEDANTVVQTAKGFAGVEDIKYYQDTVDQLLRITEFIQKGALIIIAVLIVISIVVVSNTVKLTVLAREKEIGIMKYVGATNWFIRGPFLVEGMLIGFIAAIISSAVVGVIYMKLSELLGQSAFLIFSASLVPVSFMVTNFICIFVALGVCIGAVGSIVSMRRFLDT